MTTSPHDTYTSPLASRNASERMLKLWSPRHKFNTWRKIWLAIAEAQHYLTKDWPYPLVTAEQVEELRTVVERGITDQELARAAELEAELRHDVMAHVHCLGEQCPKAKPIIHLGCTSQDVVCNADAETIQEAVFVVEMKVLRVLLALGRFIEPNKTTATLGFTHYQPAQPTTVGRRAAGWAYDLWLMLHPLDTSLDVMRPKGLRGATGTAASFMTLLGGQRDEHHYGDYDPERYHDLPDTRLEHGVAVNQFEWRWWNDDSEFGDKFSTGAHLLTGQTYPRVTDAVVLAALANIAAVLHKIATDIRLLSNRKEIDEPFGSKQIGSSAMPYKRNPMRCERICGLTRFVMNLVGNAYDTAATQWLERTLDDSSNRRLSLPEAFLALDGALDLMHNVASGLIVHEAMVKKNLEAELPFLATENILMEAVKAGGDRQDLHERIRVHAQEAGHRVKHLGLDNDLIDRIRQDPAFASVKDRLTEDDLLNPLAYTGRAVEQTERFLAEVIEPSRERYANSQIKLEDTEPKV